MFLGLSKSVLRANFRTLYNELSEVDKLIDSLAGDSEDRINKAIEVRLSNFPPISGNIQFKNQQFHCSVETETYRSHGKICQMILPSGDLGTELGDLVVAVDHILLDVTKPNRTAKIIGGACSFIQTKKEDLARKGLSTRQLYLMTQWPKFRYGGRDWLFRLFPDNSSFYLFVLDPSSRQRPKSSMISSVMLTGFLGENKAGLLSNIKGSIPLSNISIVEREPINDSTMPFTFASFLLKSLHLSVGSHSVDGDVRNFLKTFFFPKMEEVEDCPSATDLVGSARALSNNHDDWFHGKTPYNAKNEDTILGVRFKVIIRRVE